MNKFKLLLASQCLALALVSPVIASDAGSGSDSGSAAASAEAGLPAGFDAKAYVALNPDLKDYMDKNPADIAAAGGEDKWATNHYLSYGKNEGRNFKKMEAANLPAGFDAKTYVSLNPDLDQFIKDHAADVAAAGGADKWATDHYLIFGIKEGRQFKGKEGVSEAPASAEKEAIDKVRAEMASAAVGVILTRIVEPVKAKMKHSVSFCAKMKKMCDKQKAKNASDEENEKAIVNFKGKCEEGGELHMLCKEVADNMVAIKAEEAELKKSGKIGEVTMARAHEFGIIR